MDPGEQITGTRDEHYNLVSVLYHALQGVENCNAYALDAEAAGDERLATFFREAGVAQTRLAEQAKRMLGILEVPPEPGLRPEGAVPSDTGLEDVPLGSDTARSGVLPPGPEVPPTTGVPRATPGTALPDGDVEPPLTDVPDEPTAVPPDEEAISVEAASVTPQEETDYITPEDFDPTLSALEDGAAQLPIGEAVAEIEDWERRLEATGEPELQSIAGNLGALRALLSEDDIDAGTAGPLLTTLGEQVQEVAAGEPGGQVADKLRRLSELLTNEGRSLSG